MTTPISKEAEEHVLGAVMVSGTAMSAVLDAGLRPNHFYYATHGKIFESMMKLAGEGAPIDATLVAGEGHDIDKLSVFAATVPAAGYARSYAELVIEKAGWRQRMRASKLIADAVASEDMEKLAEAEGLLNENSTKPSADYSSEQLKEIARRLTREGSGKVFPWPFERLNQKTAGGMRPGEFILIGGHTSHGKSIFADQILENCQRSGASVRLYMNEMALEERVARSVARRSGIPYRKIVEGRLTDEEREGVEHEIEKWRPHGITYVAGWSAEEIAAHMRRYSWDVALLDILHLVGYQDTRELDMISSQLANVARQSNTAVLATVHLNEGRVSGQVRPRPTLGDIRGTGALKNDCDTCCFVYQQQDEETGFPLGGPSEIYFAKVRNGEVGGMKCNFNPQRLRFEPVS